MKRRYSFWNRRLLFFGLAFAWLLMSVTAKVAAEATNGRQISFAGRSWFVKAGDNLGPGPNNFSDDPQSVWVDESGKLHLKLRNISGVWSSAEVFSVNPAGYGLHRFIVESPLNALDRQVVLGMFLYRDAMNEVDVELARWGIVNETNAQFTVQPADVPGHLERFAVNTSGPTIYEFDWQPNNVQFAALSGSDPYSAIPIHDWTFAGAVPPEHPDMHVHINLWVNNPPGMPDDGQELEVIVANFQAPFEPTTFSLRDLTQPLTDCDFNLAQVYTLLGDAQSDWAQQDRNGALDALGEARFLLQTMEESCRGGPTTTLSPTQAQGGDTPAIITMTATSSQVSGTVSPQQYCNSSHKIALYALTNQWYVQPYADERRNIPIREDCTWSAATHPWDELAAHLVPGIFNIPPTTFSPSCPALGDSEFIAFACLQG